MATSFPELAGRLKKPRAIFLFKGAKAPADAALNALLPHLEGGDVVIDAGDSYYKETAWRSDLLENRSIHLMGLGLAGGAEGARRGAVITAGGTPEGYKRTRPMLEAIAAKIHGEPCVSYLGPAAACHFVKMVNAGIGHGLMQLLRETLSLAERTLPPNEEEVRDVFGAGSLDALNGCWTEVSGDVFNPLTESTLRRRIKERLEVVNNNDLAGRLAQTTLELAVEAPTIQAGLGPREAAARERRRALALTPSRQPVGRAGEDPDSVLEELHGALYAAVIIAYTEGLALLARAAQFYGFPFYPAEITRLWKGGSPLGSTLLEDIAAALRATPDLPNLLCDEDLSEKVMAHQEYLRRAVWRAHELDIGTPGMLAALEYLDTRRDAWWPVNLIQTPRWERGGVAAEVA
jgi:6-phosphogluconate dehydrogenase